MTVQTQSPPGAPPAKGMAWVPGGRFLMGSDLPEYPEEGPSHEAAVEGFWIDETPVTTIQFRRFVKRTGYVTVAERAPDPADYPELDPALLVPGSLVFTPTRGPVDLTDWKTWWRYVPGASWEHPEGPLSDVAGRELHPVTQVCWEDVVAFAEWAGKELPTEAEWEFAARGGLDGARYAWGDQLAPYSAQLANYWVGEFPWQNLKPPAERRTTPVHTFPANAYGLSDMTGNVWEWTSDLYTANHAALAGCCAPAAAGTRPPDAVGNPEGGIAHRVIKGGSHLCAVNYCQRYRPAARQAQQIDSGMSHIGFRCIVRPRR